MMMERMHVVYKRKIKKKINAPTTSTEILQDNNNNFIRTHTSYNNTKKIYIYINENIEEY